MRRSGACSSVRGLGRHDHVCVPYADDDELHRETVDYLNDGRRLGQRLMYVGAGPEEKLRDDLSSFADAGRLFADGALVVRSLEGSYEPGVPIDVEAQLAIYGGATEEALKEGFTGLRVAAEVTALVSEPSMWEAHVQWEAFADRYMASMPLSAMCCYDRRVLPKPIVSDLARVHPLARDADGLAPFRIFATDQRNTVVLDGEVDYFSADDLDRLLTLALPSDASSVLDLSELHFIDQHGVMRIAKRGADNDGLRLRNVPPATRRLCELLGVEV